MNIFLLDKNIQRCARYHCDQHVIKMILESTQILSAVLYLNNMKTPSLPSLGLLEHPQVMPEKYKVLGDPVKAYRNFYIFEKTKFAT